MIYDYQNCIDFAREQGLTEVEVKGKLETTKNIIKMGLSITQIALATGLTEKDIENLLHR